MGRKDMPELEVQLIRIALRNPMSGGWVFSATNVAVKLQPRFRNFARVTAMTWLITGMVILVVMLASAPLLHGRMPATKGPFAKGSRLLDDW
jgi:hypothetical protein